METDRAPAVPDSAALAPLCDEAEFTELIDEMVAEEAPRLFAVVQEYANGWTAGSRPGAWRSRTTPQSSEWIATYT
ncbi:MAG: hypothetical protein ACRDTA_05030 [Pseudonocardiaceae bacterium]